MVRIPSVTRLAGTITSAAVGVATADDMLTSLQFNPLQDLLKYKVNEISVFAVAISGAVSSQKQSGLSVAI